ncbi:MAG: M48 family metalloprotease [Pseudomonadota bacterium]
MDFFEHQANARRQTGRLLVYFLAAVGFTIFAVNACLFALGRWMDIPMQGGPLWHTWTPQAVLGTVLIIASGSLREYLLLRGGGPALAASMGARRLDFATRDPAERQFLNVVAEMAIASGVPAPALYVLDNESGINAFVAGLSLDQTVMVVTGGALGQFNRDELQAVVGHEFSHILNGDMRLNVRLLALLAGILAIGQVGGFLIRISFDTRRRRSRRGDSDRKGGAPQLAVLGVALWLVGYIGLFFGRLIKAAISRQREFLADASSVQFTRNPDGLASALLKIRDQHSWLSGLYAETMSHMCIAESLDFSSWLATHPPLDQRVAALGRHYLARDRVRQREQRRQVETAAEVAAVQGLSPVLTPFSPAEEPLEAPALRELEPLAWSGTPPAVPEVAVPALAAAVALAPAAVAGPAALVARTGTVNPAELVSAQALFRRLPAGVLQALESCEGAQALLLALAARQNRAAPPALAAFLETELPAQAARVQALSRKLDGLDLAFALPLTELALPRLQLMEHEAARAYLLKLQRLAQLDHHLSIFEFGLLMLMRKQLHMLPRPRPVKLAQCVPAAAMLVATLLRIGGMQGEQLERTFQRLLRTVATPPPDLPVAEATRLSQLGRYLYLLGGLSLADKRNLLELAATAVLADGKVQLEEYELLRVVAALLDCPMPVLEA